MQQKLFVEIHEVESQPWHGVNTNGIGDIAQCVMITLFVDADLEEIRPAVMLWWMSAKKIHSFFLLSIVGGRVLGRQFCWIGRSMLRLVDLPESHVYHNGIRPFFERFRLDFTIVHGRMVLEAGELHCSIRKTGTDEFQNDLNSLL